VLSDAKGTRLLFAGVVAFLALSAYLAVAFTKTHVHAFGSGTAVPSGASVVALWTVSDSKVVPLPVGRRGRFGVRVTPLAAAKGGHYGAVIQTLVADPIPGRMYVVDLGLKGSHPGQIGVELNEFKGEASQYPVQTTVPATATWHHYTLRARVKGSWLGLALYIYRADQRGRTWFAVRGLTVKLAHTHTRTSR
jgi:hypothetical protein